VIDPRRLYAPPAYDFIEYLRLLADNADPTIFDAVNLRREKATDGELWIWNSGDPSVGRFFTECVIAPDLGYSLVAYRLHDRQRQIIADQVDIQYTRINDVVVPVRYELTRMAPGEEGMRFQRVYTIETSGVNDPLDDRDFTLAGLGAEPGDRVVPLKGGAMLMVGEDHTLISVGDFERQHATGFPHHGGPQERSKFLRLEPRSDGPSVVFWSLLTINVAMLLAAGWWWLSRSTSKP
jgi:hypothetical protein